MFLYVQVGGAALDVFEEEPPKDPITLEIIQHPAVVATPHLGKLLMIYLSNPKFYKLAYIKSKGFSVLDLFTYLLVIISL